MPGGARQRAGVDGEDYLGMFQNEGRLETASIRFFNVFGLRQDPKGAYGAAVPIFIEKAMRGEDITIYGDGGQTRDFIYVKDIAGALAFAVETHGVTGVFNAGYGGQITINDLADGLIKTAGSASKVLHGTERAGDVRHSRASADKLRAAGWPPQHRLEDGLARTLDFPEQRGESTTHPIHGTIRDRAARPAGRTTPPTDPDERN